MATTNSPTYGELAEPTEELSRLPEVSYSPIFSLLVISKIAIGNRQGWKGQPRDQRRIYQRARGGVLAHRAIGAVVRDEEISAINSDTRLGLEARDQRGVDQGAPDVVYSEID